MKRFSLVLQGMNYFFQHKFKAGIISLLFLILFSSAKGQIKPVYDTPETRHWADSVLNQLSYRQKIGQLFMVDTYSNRDEAHKAIIKNLIDSSYIGGLIFFQGGPIREAVLTNYYQSVSKVPLMIGMDAEWGISMRLDSTIRFPRQMTLGAANQPDAVYKMGKEVALECRRMGIHVNFAPSVDINNNPSNPVINSRSFGEMKENVSILGSMYMKGMQDNKVLACGKHFPGHGNTDTDSHFSLPLVNSDKTELDSTELMPFRNLINDGLGSMMIAHLYIPALDTTQNLPSTLSVPVVKDLLQKEMGFNGLIFTDALNMKGVTKYFAPGDLELKALQAGNDVLLYSEDVKKAIDRIHLGIQNCEITQEEIDLHVHKILMSKCWVGLNHYTPIDTTNLVNDLNNASWLNYRLYEPSVTLLRNKNNLVPLGPYYRDCIASIAINDTLKNPFQLMLNRYAKVDCYSLSRDASTKTIDSLVELMSDYDRVIVSIHNTSTNASKNFNITESISYAVKKLSHSRKSVLCVFGNPYVLGKLEELNHEECLILAYEDTYLPQYLAAQKIFGAQEFSGRLPVSPASMYATGNGLSVTTTGRLKYTFPEETGIASSSLNSIDTIVKKAIADTVFPGCQVLVGLNGKVIYNKSFGYHRYDHTMPVKNTDLYDIASVTKMAATGLAVMLLADKHKIDPDAKVSKYLPELRKSNKRDLTIRQVLSHQAGLVSWIPFYKNTIDSNGYKPGIYSDKQEKGYCWQVAENLFIAENYADTIWQTIINSPVENIGKYVYSDLGLLIMQRVVEKVSNKSLDDYVNDNFYKPLGIWQTCFNPHDKFDSAVIIPTEIDTLFRKQEVHGFVHDPAAAMLGGVAGNAGVFSNAQSLAVIMQMLLNDGTYGGKRFLKKETVEAFTRQAYPASANRRGMVFDKPEEPGKSSPAAKDASSLAFGHTGFTGTCAWADPTNGLIYVFLSNRVYPDAANNKLAKLNIRTDIMQVVYDALKDAK